MVTATNPLAWLLPPRWWDLGRNWGTALDYLDLEGLTFVADKLADKLTSI